MNKSPRLDAARTMRRDVIVVGDGLAGLACAVELSRQGRQFLATMEGAVISEQPAAAVVGTGAADSRQSGRRYAAA
jgi:glycine/D-amino acid oxidase-like deaminating enzyme